MRLTSLMCLLFSSTLFAASPSVGLILPRGGQRGTEIELTFQGGNLSDAQEVLVYYPGITVRSIASVKPNEVKAKVAIAPDCRLGEHAFRVRTASGVSDLRTFWVGALPVLDEREPNSSFETAQPISKNVTVHGMITNEDVDYFVVECVKGERLSIEIEGMRLGTIFFDPTIAICNEAKAELAVADDAFITGQDGGASIVVPADGRYFVQVRETAYGGNGSSYYRLHVGNFPRPTAVIPAGGRPGETVEFRFLGDPLGEIKQKIKLPTSNLTMVRVHAQTDQGIHAAGIEIRVNDLPPLVESANASSLKAAAAVTIPSAFHGTLQAPGEIDYVRFKATKGQVIDLTCYARRIGSALDPVMNLDLLDKDGNPARGIQGNDDSGGSSDAAMRVTIPEDGDYALRVYDHLRGGGPNFFYRIELRPPESTAVLRVPHVDSNNRRNQDRQTWSVPKGGRIAVPMLVRRDGWNGPATLALDDLPPGVTATIDAIDFGTPTVPVILEAKADAAMAAKLMRPRLVPKEGPAVPSPPDVVDVELSAGRNNTTYHKLPTDRIAVAVAEAVPFRIEVIEPKVPLVQGGSMQLRIVATRDPSFKGPITVQPVIGLPGVGINGATTIPENATECLVPISAAGNAAPRKWRQAFSATANAGAGNLHTGSQLFTLEVAPPFVTLAQQRTAVEQGANTVVVCKVTTATPFTGKAKATLVGLPPKVTAEPIEFDSGTAEIAFQVKTDATSPRGKHKPFVQLEIVKDGEIIPHNLGGGELRIDAPRVKKTAAAAPKPTTAAPKPLSRLEQLRQEQEEREKAAAKPPEPKKP